MVLQLAMRHLIHVTLDAGVMATSAVFGVYGLLIQERLQDIIYMAGQVIGVV